MKTQNYLVLIVMGLAFALSPILVMARTSAGESAESCDDGKPATDSPTGTHESLFAAWRLIPKQGDATSSNSAQPCAV
jgi:hypothetical protein